MNGQVGDALEPVKCGASLNEFHCADDAPSSDFPWQSSRAPAFRARSSVKARSRRIEGICGYRIAALGSVISAQSFDFKPRTRVKPELDF